MMYWGLNTLLVAMTTQTQANAARPTLSRPLACRKYTHTQPAASATSDSTFNSVSSPPTRLKEWNEWSGWTGNPRKDTSQSTDAGTDSTWMGRCSANVYGDVQPPGSRRAGTSRPEAMTTPKLVAARRTGLAIPLHGGRRDSSPEVDHWASCRRCSIRITGSRRSG